MGKKRWILLKLRSEFIEGAKAMVLKNLLLMTFIILWLSWQYEFNKSHSAAYTNSLSNSLAKS